jgi:superfamily II helicase
MIIKEINKGEDALNIAIRLEFFEGIYITDEIKTIFQNEFKIRLPNKFFTGRIMGITATTKFKRRLKRKFRWLSRAISEWQKIFFSCKCGNAPYCDCSILTMDRMLVDLRMHEGLTPRKISQHMDRRLNLKIYSGDLLRFFDNLIHRLQGIQRIAKTIGNAKIEERTLELIHQIERPRLNN